MRQSHERDQPSPNAMISSTNLGGGEKYGKCVNLVFFKLNTSKRWNHPKKNWWSLLFEKKKKKKKNLTNSPKQNKRKEWGKGGVWPFGIQGFFVPGHPWQTLVKIIFTEVVLLSFSMARQDPGQPSWKWEGSLGTWDVRLGRQWHKKSLKIEQLKLRICF